METRAVLLDDGARNDVLEGLAEVLELLHSLLANYVHPVRYLTSEMYNSVMYVHPCVPLECPLYCSSFNALLTDTIDVNLVCLCVCVVVMWRPSM